MSFGFVKPKRICKGTSKVKESDLKFIFQNGQTTQPLLIINSQIFIAKIEGWGDKGVHEKQVTKGRWGVSGAKDMADLSYILMQ